MYQGHGVHDTAVVSVPLLVLLGPLLYGRRSVLLFLALGIASIVVIAGLEMNGIITTAMPASFADVAGLSVLVACAGTLVWVIVSNLEGNLRRARQSEAELRTAYDRTLESLASALAYRDWETQDHARRVVDLCVRLAKEWGLKDEQLRHIRRGALLHDIGKLAVPDRILLKPGPLSQDEWKTMRRHTAYAGRMLAGIPYLRPALAIPLSHHECWDGTGYPQRLKGRQIPVQARLFAIVDQYDALTSPRPYRKAWSKRRAIEHIKANSGRIFDPAVVSLFLRLYEQGELGRGN
jgi:HD-GYP domain-containing protein (c-di-GMP phosphodiesterase class II)